MVAAQQSLLISVHDISFYFGVTFVSALRRHFLVVVVVIVVIDVVVFVIVVVMVVVVVERRLVSALCSGVCGGWRWTNK